MVSGCPGSEWIGVGGTWLQLMCCAASRRRVPNFGRQGQGQGSEIGDDFVVRQKSDKDDKGGVVRDLGFLCDCYSVFSIDWRLKRMKNRLFI